MTNCQRRQYSAGDAVLNIPLAVNVRDLSDTQVDRLIEAMTVGLGAQYFHDKDLFLEALKDRVAAAQNPRKHLYGPFVRLVVTKNGDIRITSGDRAEGGDTVYAYDQFLGLVSTLDRKKDGSLKEHTVDAVVKDPNKYVVLNENTLCYRIEGQPRTLGILSGILLKGGRDWRDGFCFFNPDVDLVRQATLEDFEEFRVHLPPDFDGGEPTLDADGDGPSP